MHRLRVLQVPVPPDEFEPVAGKGQLAGIIHLEEGHAVGKYGIVPVPEQQGAAFRIVFRKDMHACFGRGIAQHDLEVAGNRKSASSARLIFYPQVPSI